LIVKYDQDVIMYFSEGGGPLWKP